jgi:2'-5' RNA ligase
VIGSAPEVLSGNPTLAPAAVSGSERLRLFCALRLPAEAVERIGTWQAACLRGGRSVAPEQLHVTLAFLGSRPANDAVAVVAILRAAALEADGLAFGVSGYRETRSAGMLVLTDEDGRATALAARLQQRLESETTYRSEQRAWLPHLTVLRFRERPRLDPPLPDLGEIAPSDAAVFISRLRSTGAHYDVLEAVSLGGR